MSVSQFLEINGIKVHYQEAGEGQPLVFVHGWSCDVTCWNAQLKYFSRSFRTLAYEFRGAGKSGGASPAFSMSELADDLGALLKARGVERPILCGHSLGGGIVVEYAIRNPDALTALVIAASAPPDSFVDRIQESVGGVGISRVLKLDDVLGDESSKNLLIPALCLKFFSQKFYRKQHDEIDAWKDQFRTNSSKALVHSINAWSKREDPSPLLPKLAKLPTLVIAGSVDLTFPLPEMKAFHASIPGSQFEVIKGAGHMLMVEEPKEFNEILEKFIAPFATPTTTAAANGGASAAADAAQAQQAMALKAAEAKTAAAEAKAAAAEAKASEVKTAMKAAEARAAEAKTAMKAAEAKTAIKAAETKAAIKAAEAKVAARAQATAGAALAAAPGDEDADSLPAIVVDVGKVGRKAVQELKRGKGGLMQQIAHVVGSVRSQLGEDADDVPLLPVVIVYRQKSKKWS